MSKSRIRIAIRWCAIGLFVVLCVLSVLWYAGEPDRNPLPIELTNVAAIPGIPDARTWGDEQPTFLRESIDTYSEKDYRRDLPDVYNTTHNYLAISGGGANGAYGAGLLVGWSQAGTRPEFTMVTGVSTGALTAPFAFLGPEYDDVLKTVYTTTRTEDTTRKRRFFAAIRSDSISDTTPLRAMLARYFNSDVIQAIAREHKRGRRLFIGTANLDAGRSVIWNIGAIAASEYPHKEDLIHDVLQASSALPVAFPPVMIPVEANGRTYDEMHVDGGTGSQVFVYPAVINWKTVVEKLKVQGRPKVFVIRNSFLEPDYRGVKRSILPIGLRSIQSLIRTQGIGDLYQIYSLCKRDENDFNLAYIPADFTEEAGEGFDPVYMGKLFEFGRQTARAGYPWQKWPPGFNLD